MEKICDIDYGDHEELKKFIPSKAYPQSIGFDLRATEDVCIPGGKREKVPVGFRIDFPDGFYGEIFSRSGLAHNHGVVVTQGTAVIDPDYDGIVFVSLTNMDQDDFYVKVGDAVAQLIVKQTSNVVMTLNRISYDRQTKRGAGGFGSSGVHWEMV